MADYQLVVPSNDDIKIMFNWDTSEINTSYIAGKVDNTIWIYEEYYKKFTQMLENKKRPYRILPESV